MSASDPAGGPRAAPSPATLVLALALLLGLQPVSTDLYLPALPALAAEFGGAVGRSQLTLSVLLLAFGLGQLLLGPVSDRWGRRPVLLGGLALYVLATLASTLATQLDLGRTMAWTSRREEAISRVTREQAHAALKRYLQPGAFVVGVGGDFK